MRILEVFYLVMNSFLQAEVNSFEYHWFLQTVLTSDMRWSNFAYGAAFVVLDVTKGWRNVWLNPKVFLLIVSFGIECFDTLPPSDEETS